MNQAIRESHSGSDVLMKHVNGNSEIEVVLATPPPISHRTAEENLGLSYLAAVLRSIGCGVRIIDGWLEGLSPSKLATDILNDPPTLFLGFSCYRSNMERTIEVINRLRQEKLAIPIIVGGFGPTFHPDVFLEAGFDIVVRGEAEETILDLYHHYRSGEPHLQNILGISYRNKGENHHNLSRPLIEDLDSLPLPVRDTMHLTLQRKSTVHVISSRGCQAHCVFCSIVAFQKLSSGAQWRQRSIRAFVDELESLSKSGAQHFKVIDDSLIEPPRNEEWCRELANEIEARGLNVRLRGSIRADRVNEEVVRELKRAGFFAFSCGIENGSETALKRMGKKASLKQNTQALEILNKYGIYVQAGHILFDHGTTLVELEENYEFMQRFIWTVSKGIFTEMYAANGTPFTKRLQGLGIFQVDATGLGNNKYPVLDNPARSVYSALKLWHKNHSHVYDMVIDPLSAPKAIGEEHLQAFHALSMELRKYDLAFMRNILDSAHRKNSEAEMLQQTVEEIEKAQGLHNNIEAKARSLYIRADIVYDAEENPFLC